MKEVLQRGGSNILLYSYSVLINILVQKSIIPIRQTRIVRALRTVAFQFAVLVYEIIIAVTAAFIAIVVFIPFGHLEHLLFAIVVQIGSIYVRSRKWYHLGVGVA